MWTLEMFPFRKYVVLLRIVVVHSRLRCRSKFVSKNKSGIFVFFCILVAINILDNGRYYGWQSNASWSTGLVQIGRCQIHRNQWCSDDWELYLCYIEKILQPFTVLFEISWTISRNHAHHNDWPIAWPANGQPWCQLLHHGPI